MRCALVAGGMMLALAAFAAPQDQLVAHWQLDEAPFESVASDVAGSFNGNLSDCEFVRSGYRAHAVLFGAAGENRIDFPGTENLLTGNNWTVSFWFRHRNQSGGGSKLRTMFSTGNAGSTGVSISATRSNGSELQFRVGDSERYFPFDWDLGWHHVVLVRDGAVARAFADGEYLGEFAPGSAASGAIRLGRDKSNDTTRRYNGFVDEVRVYSRSLSADEVLEIRDLHPLPPRVSIPYTSDFAGGNSGYYCFRIPSVMTAADGTVLAFAEGRVGNCDDELDINVVLRRSFDGGATWEPLQVVWDEGGNTAGNPTPVLDRDTDRIWLLMSHNLGQDTLSEIVNGTSDGARTVWATFSDDHGATWAPAYEITPQVKQDNWRWYATGPGVGIQTQAGRLVIPVTYNTGTGSANSAGYVFYSDDHGESWQMGGSAWGSVSEAQVVELMDGRLMLNMRRSGSSPLYRRISTSADGGATWTPITVDYGLPDCSVQGSILRYTRAGESDANRILFSNPANNATSTVSSRTRMTVRMSTDEAATWQYARELYAGWSIYSCLTVFDDYDIGCLYEWGDGGRYQRIIFERFGADWLTGGEVQLPPSVTQTSWMAR